MSVTSPTTETFQPTLHRSLSEGQMPLQTKATLAAGLLYTQALAAQTMNKFAPANKETYIAEQLEFSGGLELPEVPEDQDQNKTTETKQGSSFFSKLVKVALFGATLAVAYQASKHFCPVHDQNVAFATQTANQMGINKENAQFVQEKATNFFSEASTQFGKGKDFVVNNGPKAFSTITSTAKDTFSSINSAIKAVDGAKNSAIEATTNLQCTRLETIPNCQPQSWSSFAADSIAQSFGQRFAAK